MVESEAKEQSEAIMLGAVMFGHQQMQVAIQAIKELAAELGVHRQTLWEWGSDGLTARGRVLINNAAKRLQFWLPPDFMERKCR